MSESLVWQDEQEDKDAPKERRSERQKKRTPIPAWTGKFLLPQAEVTINLRKRVIAHGMLTLQIGRSAGSFAREFCLWKFISYKGRLQTV